MESNVQNGRCGHLMRVRVQARVRLESFRERNFRILPTPETHIPYTVAISSSQSTSTGKQSVTDDDTVQTSFPVAIVTLMSRVDRRTSFDTNSK